VRLAFFGAARSVTGSMHALEVGGVTVLLECGLFQGRRAEAAERNRRFPFPPREIAAVLLSHAHIDHSGNLPGLVRAGFRGTIHATEATVDLAEVMLRDSGHIQESDAEFLRRTRGEHVEPLYKVEDVERTLPRFAGRPYGAWFPVAPGVRARFHDAGHILGSASVEVEASEPPRSVRIVFTGDLGRRGLPILRDPSPLPAADVFLTESTYGDRLHPPLPDLERDLAEILSGCARGGGKIVVPAFSVGRTQNLLYVLHRLYERGEVPRIPIYVDSPLSTRATRVVASHPEVFDAEARAVLGSSGSPFYFREVHYLESTEESKQLNDAPGPMLILSASGMCETGRILHHLRHALPDPRNLVLIVGFQAEHTLGRRLLKGASFARVLGSDVPVRARVVSMEGWSAHADRDELLAALAPRASGAQVAFVVHGEEGSALALAGGLRDAGFRRVEVPSRGEAFPL
jgi:metallo-beta-lactamase family protein